MPPVAAALAALSIADVLIFVAKLAVSIAISAVFSKKSPSAVPQPNLADLSQTLTTLEPAAPWEIVYGQVRKGGRLVFRHATDSISSEQVVESHVIPHTAPYIVVPQQVADYVSDVGVTVRIFQNVEEQVYTETPLTSVGTNPGPSQYEVVGLGTHYLFNAEDAGKSIQITYNRRTVGSAHNRLHLVIVLAAHECEEIGEIYFNDELVPLDGDGNATGRYANHVLVKKHLGASDQAADATLILEAPDKWTADHRLRGHAYIYVRLLRNRELFPTGIPNITAMVKGRKVYDTRTATTAWTANAALCVADYLNHATWGLGAAYGTEIDDTLLNAAANVADEAVTVSDESTEDRYTCNGIVDTSQQPQYVIERMLTSLAGRVVFIGGKWRLRAGAYITPTVTLDEGDARGPIRVQTRRSRRDVFNAVKGVYVSPANNWQPSDFPAVVSDVYLAQDNGERVWENIDLDYTTSPATAQRIAKIVLERIRRQVTVSYPANLTAYRVEPPETLMLNNTKFGYSAKVFEVMELGLVIDEDEQGQPILGVDLALQETDSAVYTWTAAEEQEVPAAPTTSLPDPRQVAPPGIPWVTEQLYETNGSSGVKAKAIVQWAPAPQGQAWRYEHEWKSKSASSWTPNDGLINGTYDEIFDLAAGRYQSRVRTVTALGARSEWSQVEFETIGLTAPPGDVIGFAVQGLAGLAKFTWQKSTDIDVSIGGRVFVRWTPIMSGATWNEGALVNPDGYPGDTSIAFGPLQTGTYLAKFRDSSGNYSENAASFVATEALVTGLSTLDSVTFHPAFAATLDDTVVAGGALQLDSSGAWDAQPGNIDDWTDLVDFLGGILSSGTATFDDGIDLGSVQTVRLFTHMESEAFDTGDTWDARTNSMESWGLVDGDVIEDAEVEIMVRVSNTDPTPGSPTPIWGDWHPLGLVADYNARAFEFRADFTTADPTHNRRVTELTITAKQ